MNPRTFMSSLQKRKSAKVRFFDKVKPAKSED